MSMDDNDPRKKFLPRFKEEADRNLLILQRRLVDLESEPENKNYLNEIFRAAHTIKGGARMMNFTLISSVAHEMEEIFVAMRDDKLKLQPEINDSLFEAAEVVTEMVNSVARGGPEQVDGLDVDELKTRLKAVTSTEAAPPTPPVPVADTPVQPGVEPVAVPTPPVVENNARIIATGVPGATAQQPAAPTPRPGLNDNVIQVDVGKLDELMNITGELVLGKMEAENTLNQMRILQELVRQRQRLSTPIRNLLASSGRDWSELTTWQEIRETLAGLSELDLKVDNLVKNTLRTYEEHTSELVNRVDELENNVKSVRMLPLDTLYERYSILSVRAMARREQKEIAEVRYFGGDIELDKKVLEGLNAPLFHLINNSIYHGIEKPDDRQAVGKSRGGTITLSAQQDGGYVSLKVSDDGGGVNVEIVREKALKTGLIDAAKARTMSDEDISYLIFEPGLSTAKLVTDTAGRGVGLDLVKTNIERLGGQVLLHSEPGVGTTFTLRVPVTLATSRALIVRANNNLYAIQAASIEAMLYLQPEDIFTLEGREVTMVRNGRVTIVRLADILGRNQHFDHPLFQFLAVHHERLINDNGMGTSTNGSNGSKNGIESGYYSNGNGNGNGSRDVLGDGFTGLTLADPYAGLRIRELMEQTTQRRVRQLNQERLPAVVVKSGDRRICFVVDELVDETEIVVKSLGKLLRRAIHVSSATIMGDGQVVMILDVPSLITAARNISQSGVRRDRAKQSSRKRILVVDDSITTRELERSILEANGYVVELADDGTVALDILGRDTNFDVVVSDVEMPNMNGFELTSRLTSNATLRQIPVIIVSSLYSDEHKRRGIEAGARAYISKGDFEQDNLLNTIEYLTN
jgi:two-component system, chemotaxis family, sensor kinase CheA